MPGTDGILIRPSFAIAASWREDEDALFKKQFENEAQRETSQTDSLFDEAAKQAGAEYLPYPNGLDPAMLVELFHADPTHHACCIVKARAIAAGGFHFERSDGRAGKPPKPLRQLFDEVFPAGLDEFIYELMLDYETTGNAYFEVIRSVGKPASGGTVKALVPVPSFTVRRVPPGHQSQCAFVQLYSGFMRYFREFGQDKPLRLPPKQKIVNEMVQVRNHSPNSVWYGLPDIISALNALLGARRAVQYLVDIMESKGMPNYLLILQGARQFVLDEDRQALNRYLQQMLDKGGGRILVIGTPNNTEAQLEKLSMNIEADALVNLIKECRDQIARAHGVPPRLLSIIESGRLGGANEAATELEQFRQMVLTPRQRMWENVLYRVLIYPNRKLRDWRIRFNPIDLQDIQREMQAYTGYVKTGILSVNEARAKLGYTPITGGDEHVFLSAGGEAIPLSDLVASPAADRDAEDQQEVQE